MSVLVNIIIVNYRTPELTYFCLISLSNQRIKFPGFSVIVVDNNSGDDSLFYLKEKIAEHGWNEWITILPSPINGGFAAGNNVALESIVNSDDCPEYIMLLNPDTVVQDNAVANLVHFLNEHNAVGVVGAQLQDAYNKLESTARRFPTYISELINGAEFSFLSKMLKQWQVPLPIQNHAYRCDWVSGAAMMVRSKIFQQIGVLDDGYFLYFEELDFCRRVNVAGWQIWLDPSAVVTHLEGQATGIHNVRKRRAKYWFDSRRRFFVKHYGVLYWIIADLLWSVGRVSLYLRRIFRLGGESSSEPLCFFRDLLIGDLCALLIGDVLRIPKMRKSVFLKFSSCFSEKGGVRR